MTAVCPEVDDPFPEGAIIGERYRVRRRLGRGGMGIVYEAEHLVTGRTVAVKAMHAEFASDPTLVRRFLREARAASKIQHPHAIEIIDVFPESGAPMMVMEHLTGEDLDERVQRGPLDPGELVRIMLPVVDALSAAHERGIVHRDLKPENIFLSHDQSGGVVPKVLDFGIAKVVSDRTIDPQTMKLTSTGMMLGTPYYMSPEQVSGRDDLDHRTDIWSLGVIMYTALTGRQPFRGQNFGQLFTNILLEQPTPIEQLAPHVPAELCAIVSWCLQKDREARPASCRELAQALAPLADRCATAPAGRAPAPVEIEAAPSGVVTPRSRPSGAETAALAATLPSGEFGAAATPAVPPPRRRRPLVLAGALGALLLAGLGAWGLDAADGGEDDAEPGAAGHVEPAEEPGTDRAASRAAAHPGSIEPEPQAGHGEAGRHAGVPAGGEERSGESRDSGVEAAATPGSVQPPASDGTTRAAATRGSVQPPDSDGTTRAAAAGNRPEARRRPAAAHVRAALPTTRQRPHERGPAVEPTEATAMAEAPTTRQTGLITELE